MSVLYLLSSPPPVVPETDAVLQEVEVLRKQFGGAVRHLTPLSAHANTVPLPLYGLHLVPMLLRSAHDRVHVFHSDLYDFPALRMTRRPLIFTVTTGVDHRRLPRGGFASKLEHIVVPTDDDRDAVERWGVASERVSVVVPGIDRSRFGNLEPLPAPTGGEKPFVLLAGSAPWTEAQFRTKGLEALLEVVGELPALRLILLWRGVLRESLDERVSRLGVSERVEIVDERVEVPDLLSRVHAGVVLAESRELVKAHPHSLLECLACGRPVLVSGTVALSRFVASRGCGLVVPELSRSAVRTAVERLIAGYDRYRSEAASIARDGRAFSNQQMLEAYQRVYGR